MHVNMIQNTWESVYKLDASRYGVWKTIHNYTWITINVAISIALYLYTVATFYNYYSLAHFLQPLHARVQYTATQYKDAVREALFCCFSKLIV